MYPPVPSDPKCGGGFLHNSPFPNSPEQTECSTVKL